MSPVYRSHADDVQAADVVRRSRWRGPERAHADFGGLDLPAVLVGLLVAIATQLILWVVYGVVAGSTVDVRQDAEQLVLGTFVAGVIIMFIAYFAGGWAAGRMSRYDGLRNGIAVPILALLLAVITGALGLWAGDRFDVLAELGLPNWMFNAVDDLGNEALLAAIAAPVAMLVGGVLGGRFGDSYHRRVDAEMLPAEPTTTATTVVDQPADEI